jgi:uncharacterized protein YndB with AHSA1/START domain/DNA-binding transcriptional ArsR family regulator
MCQYPNSKGGAMDAQQAFAAIGEPTRFRILTLLADGPRTVGEVAAALGALQPQTTKHLQALEAAGVVRVQRLGRRRLASVDREALATLAGWLSGLAVATEDDRALEGYAAAVAQAEREAARSPLSVDVALERRIDAPREAVWRAWTDPEVAARWWAPRHFDVVRCRIAPQPGAPVELVIREGDGAEYTAAGVVSDVETGTRIAFDLSPRDAQGRVLFPVSIEVRLAGGPETMVTVAIHADGGDRATAAMLAGLEPGWSQQLDRLEELLTRG